jgi:CubicO group peptidase (beta-lactamase class C family)
VHDGNRRRVFPARSERADLDRGEPLGPGHRFPVPGVTALVTATAALTLVADGPRANPTTDPTTDPA